MASRLGAALGVDPADITVVPNVASEVFASPDLWEPIDNLPERLEGVVRLGMMGAAYAHKNHDFLGELSRLLEWRYGIVTEILCTLTESEWQARSELFRRYAVNLGRISVRQCPEFYSSVDATVFPSLLEAASATPLEAMAMGSPLLASDRAFVRSMCGSAAIYFDPVDAEAAAATLAEALADHQLLATHRHRGSVLMDTWPTGRDRAIAYLDLVSSALSSTGRP